MVLRLEALELLTRAQAIDHLVPVQVMHQHEYGDTHYLVGAPEDIVSENSLRVDALASVLDSKFDEDKGESLSWERVSLTDLSGSNPTRIVHEISSAILPQP